MGRRDGTGELLNSSKVRKALVEKFKDIDGVVRCCSCGSSENIEWHHAISLGAGGHDVFTNLIPACHICHAAQHAWEVSRFEKAHKKNTQAGSGRKYAVPENYKELVNDYIYCRIGKNELGKRWNKAMGVENDKIPDAVNHISDRPWFRKYLDELGIKKIHNGIDAHIRVKDGTVLGTITYLDGHKEDIRYTELSKCDKDIDEFPDYEVRKRKYFGLPENYKQLLTDFTFGKIGFKELLANWDVDPQSTASLVNYKSKSWYKEFLEELGIARAMNKVDKPSAADINRGVVGYVLYKTGKVKDLYR